MARHALYGAWLRAWHGFEAALRSLGFGTSWALLAAWRAAQQSEADRPRGTALSGEASFFMATAWISDGFRLFSAKKRQGITSVPHHVAVIMDGNRRYGRQTYGDSLSGHKAGGEKLRDFILWCTELGFSAILGRGTLPF